MRFNLEDAKAEPWVVATTASCLVGNGREKQDQLVGWAAKPFLVIKLYFIFFDGIRDTFLEKRLCISLCRGVLSKH